MTTQYRLILLAAALHVSAQAQTQLSTLDGVGDNALSFGAAGENVSWYGFGFYVGGVPTGFPGSFTPGDFSLASVSAMLSHTSEGAMHAELFLADNVNGLPVGPAVAEFSFSAIGGASDLVTFTPNASVTVTTDQAYFFGLTPTSGVWNWSLTNDYTGTYSNEDNGWTLIGIAGGGTISGDPVAWSNYSYFDAPRIAIATSAIPEPSTYAACAGALGLALAVGWRRRRANVPASGS